MTSATATPELKIEPKLPVLAFNFEQLKAWATDIAERYANMVVTEEAVADARRDMADINKAKKAVDDARKEAVKRVSEPIRTFETQIKEVCAIFDKAYSTLGEQVKGFEDKQREAKRKDVEGLIIEANLNAFGNPAHLDIPIQDKWLNKTASWKSIRDDLDAIVQRHIEEEKRKAALEQARQDRAAAIENHVKSLNASHGYDLSVALFMGESFLDLSVPLTGVQNRIAQFFFLEKEKRERQAKSAEQKPTGTCVPPVSHKQACVSKNAESETQASPAQTTAMSIVLEYDIANEAQVQACLENLKSLCVGYAARKR